MTQSGCRRTGGLHDGFGGFGGFSERVQRVKTQRVETSENFAEEKCSQKIFQKISQNIEDITFTLDFRVFLEILAEECFLLGVFGSFCPLVLTLKPMSQ